MIRSKLKRLRVDAEDKQGRKLTYRTIASESGLSYTTIVHLMNNNVQRVEFATLDALCRYFKCQVGDLLEFRDDPPPA